MILDIKPPRTKEDYNYIKKGLYIDYKISLLYLQEQSQYGINSETFTLAMEKLKKHNIYLSFIKKFQKFEFTIHEWKQKINKKLYKNNLKIIIKEYENSLFLISKKETLFHLNKKKLLIDFHKNFYYFTQKQLEYLNADLIVLDLLKNNLPQIIEDDSLVTIQIRISQIKNILTKVLKANN